MAVYYTVDHVYLNLEKLVISKNWPAIIIMCNIRYVATYTMVYMNVYLFYIGGGFFKDP